MSAASIGAVGFTFMMIYFTSRHRGAVDPVAAARSVLIPLFIIQAIILMFFGTGSVTSGIIHERVEGTLDYQRLAPMSPISKIVGYVFGLPIREYAMFALTMPFMIFVVVRGEVPLGSLAHTYLIFFTSVVLYHMIGIVSGLVLKEWRFSALLTQGLVVFINLILPMVSHLGFQFLHYLTARPVLAEKIFPLLSPQFQNATRHMPFLAPSNAPFFGWEFSGTTFSLIIQGWLILTFGLMVYRKWKNAAAHPLGKGYAMAFFFMLELFILGNLWPNLVRSDRALPMFGSLGSRLPEEELVLALPMVFIVITLAALFWLLLIITPTRHEYLRGLRRGRKLGLPRSPLLSDEAGSLLPTLVFVAITVTVTGIILGLMNRSGFYQRVDPSWFELVKLPAATALVVVHVFVVLEYLEIRRLLVLALLSWVAPVLLGIFLAAAFEMEEPSLYFASPSPITFLALGAAGPMTGMANDPTFTEVSRNAFLLGALFLTLFTTWMAFRLKAMKTRFKTL